uniref:C-type lectin domain-containing protein n=1 Tax=Cyprinus carpio TaxID=7962 RepID=A0A8C1VFT0_CYPCA
MSACSFPINPLDYKENYFLCNIRNLTSMSYSCHFFLSIRGLDQLNTVDFPAAGILSKASCDLYRIVLIEDPKTWTEAQSYCREKYMDLATVQSDEDRAKLKEAADAVNFQSVAWIGFYRVRNWRWSYQNTMISYAMWNSGEPNIPDTDVACVVVRNNRLWSDRLCTDLNSFFCQTGKKLYNTHISL